MELFDKCKNDQVCWVRNLPDSRVEVMASGEEEPIKLLHRWLQQGPEHTRVLKV